MANISLEQKLDNYRNMVSMIKDYDREYSRWPTTQEFVEKLEMGEATVRRYKRDILAQSTKELFNNFNYDTIDHTKKLLSEINKQVKDYEEMYKKPTDNADKKDTGRMIIDYHIEAIKIMRDIPTFLGDDNEQSEQERIHGQIDSEKIKKGFESIND